MMFDHLYVLAHGGVAIFSGPPTTISTHIGNIILDSTTDMSNRNVEQPIETLIKYSCSGTQIESVQKLMANVLFIQPEELLEEAQLVTDGVVQNRNRFSFVSVYILFCRYLCYIRGHLWKEWLFYVIMYLGYAFVIRIFFDPDIALPSGCLNLEDDFNNTCARSHEALMEDKMLANSFKFNFFMSNMFQFLVLVQISLSFGKELIYFSNEHRNGWYSSGSFYLMKALLETVWVAPMILIYVVIINIYNEVRPGIYWHFVQIFLLSSFGIQGVSHIFSILANGKILPSMIMTLATYLISCLLGNFFVKLERLHYFYKFLSQISIAKFTFQAGVLLEYGFGRCQRNEIQTLLYSLGINDDYYHYSIWMLVFNLMLFRIIAIVLLICKANPQENRRHRVKRIAVHNQQLQKLDDSNTIIVGL